MALVQNTLVRGRTSRHRLVTGAPVGADAAPGGGFPNPRSCFNADGYDTVLASVQIAPGAASVDLQPLLYDPESGEFLNHANTGSLTDGDVAEIAAVGGRMFVRIDATVGDPTSVEIRISGGQVSQQGG